jgi:hypothetical protein
MQGAKKISNYLNSIAISIPIEGLNLGLTIDIDKDGKSRK